MAFMSFGRFPSLWDCGLKLVYDFLLRNNKKKNSLQITNGEEGVQTRNPSTLLVGVHIDAATMENSVEVPPKAKNKSCHMTLQSHF